MRVFVTLIAVLATLFIIQHKVKNDGNNIDEAKDSGDIGRDTPEPIDEPIDSPKENEATKNSDVPSWINTKTEDMSAQDVFDYFAWSNHSSCPLINDFGGKFKDKNEGRLRYYDGQKAVCLLPQSVAPTVSSCLVYSFGIKNEWSFDDAMEKYGCEVYSFDPSMLNATEKFDHSPKVHFNKIGLGPKNTITGKGWKVRNFESIRNMLGHRNRIIDYLKIDIETGEWGILPQLMQTGEFDNVKQLGLDVHIERKFTESNLNELKGYVQVLRTMERDFGMVRFDSKINPFWTRPFSYMNNRVLSLGYEIAWYNQKFIVPNSNLL